MVFACKKKWQLDLYFISAARRPFFGEADGEGATFINIEVLTVTEEQEKKKKKDSDSRWDGDDDQFPKIPKANTQIAHWKVCQLKVEKTEGVSPRLQNFLIVKDIITESLARVFWPKIAKFSIAMHRWWFSPLCIQMDSFNSL